MRRQLELVNDFGPGILQGVAGNVRSVPVEEKDVGSAVIQTMFDDDSLKFFMKLKRIGPFMKDELVAIQRTRRSRIEHPCRMNPLDLENEQIRYLVISRIYHVDNRQVCEFETPVVFSPV